MPKPALTRFEKHLGPTSKWAGHCSWAATKAVEHRLVPKGSVTIRGHWTGDVHPESMFARGTPFVQHTWILQPDGNVCDPTRWVFEHVTPYIYVGAADHYDEGGNEWRMRMLGSAPKYNPDELQIVFSREVLLTAAWKFAENLLGPCNAEPGVVSIRQLYWLGNLDPDLLGEHAPALYAALAALGHDALVPYDNWQRVERLRGTPAKKGRRSASR